MVVEHGIGSCTLTVMFISSSPWAHFAIRLTHFCLYSKGLLRRLIVNCVNHLKFLVTRVVREVLRILSYLLYFLFLIRNIWNILRIAYQRTIPKN